MDLFANLLNVANQRREGQMEGQGLLQKLQMQLAQTKEQTRRQGLTEALQRAQLGDVQAQEAQRRAGVEQAQRQRTARVQTLRRNPAYTQYSDDELEGIASDPEAFRRAAGLAKAEGPTMGSPEWLKAITDEARVKAQFRPPPREPSEGKITDGERKAGAFYSRLVPVSQRLNEFDDPTILNDLASRKNMLGLSNWAKTPKGRQLEQNARTWVMTVLRPESGATITPDEMEGYYTTYIPRPGDDDTTLQLKRQARQEAEESIRLMGGRAAPAQAPRPVAPMPRTAPTPAQMLRARNDPEYAAYLKSKGQL